MDRIILPRAGRETIFLTMRARPAFADTLIVEVQQAGDTDWTATTNTVVDGEHVTAQFLVNGPDFTPDETPSMEIDADTSIAVRFRQHPDVVIRDGVYIALGD